MAVALLGTGVSRGIAIGPARLLQRGRPEIPRYRLAAHRIEAEIERFRSAVGAAASELRAILDDLPAGTSGDIAAFVETHLLMLRDATLSAAPGDLIRRERCNAEWALEMQQDALVKVFDAVEDDYLRTRRDDVAHVVTRIQQILLDDTARRQALATHQERDRIILADDLAPSELVLLHKQGVGAVVAEHGGPVSHAAILARSLGIPAVFGIHHALQFIEEGEMLVVDGAAGSVLAGLEDPELRLYRTRRREERRRRVALRRLRDRPAITRDGFTIELFANIEMPGDLDAVRKAGAGGVGLYRTEFLYMNRASLPDEEEQYATYLDAVSRLEGAPLTIRTLDLGADKQAADGQVLSASDSPLGMRAIRLCLSERDLFLPQLRAILRASAHGPVSLLIPMLTSIDEVLQVRMLLDECRRQLRRQRLPFDSGLPLGGMIEVPAAALCAEEFARELDFLSIGTNDLIQYTLAADRMDEAVNHLYDPLHPAVLKLLRLVLDAAARTDTPVSMCGEMAGDPALTRLLLGLGLTRFSMPPTAVPEVKRVVTGSHLRQLQEATAACIESSQGFRALALRFNEGEWG